MSSTSTASRSTQPAESQTIEPFSVDSAENVAEVEDAFRPVTRKEQTLVLLCAFLVIFQTIGFNQSYGVFQDYYTSDEQDIIPPAEADDRAFLAFTGALSAGLTWAGGLWVNSLMARTKRPVWIMLAGVLLMSLGFGLASLAHHSWQLLLTQGLLYGLGSAMVYFPPVAVAPEYFDERRGAAMGFILSAAGIGGLVLSPVTRALLTRLGARWTLRFLCLFNLVIGIPIASLCPPSRSVRSRPTMVNTHVARSPLFLFAILGAFLQSGGYFVPLTFFSSFSSTLGYSSSFAAILLGISNGVNAVSRVGMGFAADKVGRQNTLIFCCVGSAASVLILWMVAAAGAVKAAWLVFVIAYGIFSGGYNALLPTTISDIFGVHTYPSINGLLYFVRGCGVFFGAPVGGTILGDIPRNLITAAARAKALDSFRKLIWYDGSLLIACSVCVILVRVTQAKDRGLWKWKA